MGRVVGSTRDGASSRRLSHPCSLGRQVGGLHHRTILRRRKGHLLWRRWLLLQRGAHRGALLPGPSAHRWLQDRLPLRWAVASSPKSIPRGRAWGHRSWRGWCHHGSKLRLDVDHFLLRVRRQLLSPHDSQERMQQPHIRI